MRHEMKCNNFMPLKIYYPILLKGFYSFSTVETTLVDNNNGSYTVSYTPEEPGAYSVWVCVKAQHVKVPNHLTGFIIRE